jgi:hypothetical protein
MSKALSSKPGFGGTPSGVAHLAPGNTPAQKIGQSGSNPIGCPVPPKQVANGRPSQSGIARTP